MLWGFLSTARQSQQGKHRIGLSFPGLIVIHLVSVFPVCCYLVLTHVDNFVDFIHVAGSSTAALVGMFDLIVPSVCFVLELFLLILPCVYMCCSAFTSLFQLAQA